MINHILEHIDRVFLVVFARFRREIGDSKLRSAWRGACFRVEGFLVVPTGIFAAALTAAVYWIRGFEPSLGLEVKRSAQIAAILSGVLVATLLHVHFKKFLLNPPALSPKESPAEGRLVVWFRAIAIGVGVLLLALGTLWREFQTPSP